MLDRIHGNDGTNLTRRSVHVDTVIQPRSDRLRGGDVRCTFLPRMRYNLWYRRHDNMYSIIYRIISLYRFTRYDRTDTCFLPPKR